MPGFGCTMLAAMFLLPLLLNAVLGFKLCPSPCLCYESSDLVDCRSRGLTRVPSSISHGTWLLDLSLDLSFNRLRWLPQDFSQGLYSLQELRLSNNLLQHLDSKSLEDCGSLRKLDLSYNHIRGLDIKALSSLPAASNNTMVKVKTRIWKL
uniref:LRRNT domain-containing protein n=1 Tax=Pundamilia nyererei TaxID=303518 RepID=A0A3B4F5D4_9CICH